MYKKYIVKISINILKNKQTGNRRNERDHSTSNTQPGNKTNRTNMYSVVNFRKLENPNNLHNKTMG